MHDVNGTRLNVGDIVTIEARITELSGGDDFCNVSLDTVIGRRPDGNAERITAINTGVLVLRASAAVPPRVLNVPGVQPEQLFMGSQVADIVAGLELGKDDQTP